MLVRGTLNAPISVFGGIDDRKVCYGDLAPWCEQTEWSFKTRILPGDHFFLRDSQLALFQPIYQDLESLTLL